MSGTPVNIFDFSFELPVEESYDYCVVFCNLNFMVQDSRFWDLYLIGDIRYDADESDQTVSFRVLYVSTISFGKYYTKKVSSLRQYISRYAMKTRTEARATQRGVTDKEVFEITMDQTDYLEVMYPLRKDKAYIVCKEFLNNLCTVIEISEQNNTWLGTATNYRRGDYCAATHVILPVKDMTPGQVNKATRILPNFSIHPPTSCPIESCSPNCEWVNMYLQSQGLDLKFEFHPMGFSRLCELEFDVMDFSRLSEAHLLIRYSDSNNQLHERFIHLPGLKYMMNCDAYSIVYYTNDEEDCVLVVPLECNLPTYRYDLRTALKTASYHSKKLTVWPVSNTYNIPTWSSFEEKFNLEMNPSKSPVFYLDVINYEAMRKELIESVLNTIHTRREDYRMRYEHKRFSVQQHNTAYEIIFDLSPATYSITGLSLVNKFGINEIHSYEKITEIKEKATRDRHTLASAFGNGSACFSVHLDQLPNNPHNLIIDEFFPPLFFVKLN